MKADLGIPGEALGATRASAPVTSADIPALVEVAINDTCHQTNPRPCTREDFERLFADGDLRPTPCSRSAFRRASSTRTRKRAIFKGMTLQYIEQNVAHWLMQRDVLAFMVPSPDGPHAARRQPGARSTPTRSELDGLVLMGGSDVCPESYGEKALRPEWNGDRIRDDYEIALLRAFMALQKPVLGVCRGAQVINVGAGRHALPGPRDAGAARAQPSQLGDLRAELPCDVVRPRQRPRPALSRRRRSSRPTRSIIRR